MQREEVKMSSEMQRRRFLQLSLAASAAASLASCSLQHKQNQVQPTEASTKLTVGQKGIGLALGESHDVAQLDALKVEWFYTWGSSYPESRPPEKFVPMIWGGGSVRRGSVDTVLSEVPVSRASELLGFNEPDHPAQADMSVAAALKYWPKLEASGLRLGSPGPVHINGEWFKEFMDKAASKSLRVDFIAMHSYASPESESFLETLQEVYNRYGKPIWVTEYAVADWQADVKSPSKHSEKDILAFLRETVVGMRAMPFVERFAWKTRAYDDPVMGASALFRKDGSLTPTGELYRSL